MNRQQAARRNGALSHGPTIAAGKAASAQNATKHGLTSKKMFVLQNENPERWAEMFEMCIEAFQPATPLEYKLVEEIAGAKWRLRRLRYIETGLFDLEMDQQAEAVAAKYDVVDEAIRQASAFKALADESRSLSLLIRYEGRLQRAYDSGVQNLKDLRAETAKHEPQGLPLPNEPEASKTEPAVEQECSETSGRLSSNAAPLSPAPALQWSADRKIPHMRLLLPPQDQCA